MFFLFCTCFSLVYTSGTLWVAYREATAEPTPAVIVSDNSRYRPGLGFTVKFPTSNGDTCISSIERDSVPGNVWIGDTITVLRPTAGDQCLATGDRGSNIGLGVLIGLIFLTIGIVGSYFAWFRTAPDGRIRW